MSSFTTLVPQLSDETLMGVESFGFNIMTPVQASTIPLFLSHKDVCVEATTGSGKTLAFGIPIFEMLSRKRPALKKHEIGALVIAPTRELATQIYEVFQKFQDFHQNLNCMLLVGGTSVQDNIEEFERIGASILIGTPGRLMDLINRCNLLNFKEFEVLVLDEADTLLDMGFRDTINQILNILPKQRRTGLFSATQTSEVKDLARAGMRNPVTICVKVQRTLNTDMASKSLAGENEVSSAANPQIIQNNIRKQTTPSTLENYYLVAEYDQRPYYLLQFLREHQNQKIIIFVSTCACVDYYSEIFYQIYNKNKNTSNNEHSISSTSASSVYFPVLGLHGKMVPKKRNGVYHKFINSTCGALFCTDVAARGIDIPDVDWIVQYTAPKDPAFFIHRVGRTARAGRAGGALLFITDKESAYIELLKNRGVPMREKSHSSLAPIAKDKDGQTVILSGEVNEIVVEEWSPAVLRQDMRGLLVKDRDLLEKSSNAFMSFLRAYKEHKCSYIFRIDDLDIGSVARAYALLRLPRIPETRGRKGDVNFDEAMDIDISAIPYLNKSREEARLRRLASLKLEKQKLQEQEFLDKGNNEVEMKKRKGLELGNHETEIETKRKRAKKQGMHSKIMDLWDELAAEEYVYKQYKKGNLKQSEYDDVLFSEEGVLDVATNIKEAHSKVDIESGDDDDLCGGSDDEKSGGREFAEIVRDPPTDKSNKHSVLSANKKKISKSGFGKSASVKFNEKKNTKDSKESRPKKFSGESKGVKRDYRKKSKFH